MWLRKHWPKQDQCKGKLGISTEYTTATLKHTLGAFIALTVGLSVSMLALIVEIICHKLTIIKAPRENLGKKYLFIH